MNKTIYCWPSSWIEALKKSNLGSDDGMPDGQFIIYGGDDMRKKLEDFGNALLSEKITET